MDHQPNPGPELKQLNFLVGKWNTNGEARDGASGQVNKITGTDSYEWVAGGCFLLHRVEVVMGDEKVEAIEIIGEFDAASNTYHMRSFDNQGNFITMRASIESAGVLKISGELMRSTLVLSKEGNHMTANWERFINNATWTPWIEMQFTK